MITKISTNAEKICNYSSFLRINCDSLQFFFDSYHIPLNELKKSHFEERHLHIKISTSVVVQYSRNNKNWISFRLNYQKYNHDQTQSVIVQLLSRPY